MSNRQDRLPTLDCHAHIAPDVTHSQLATLGHSHVFAVTRSLSEARLVMNRDDRGLTWGIGVHPAVATARAEYNPEVFRQLLPQFALVGEVGLDRRGTRDEQERILGDVLGACDGKSVMISIHSTGRTREVLDLVKQRPHPGVILHWFLGTSSELTEAVRLGTFFSVNSAMGDALLTAMPRDRVLPETDFPARPVRARTPGETTALEKRLATLWRISVQETRHQLWTNLKRLAVVSGAIDVVSESLADTLLTV